MKKAKRIIASLMAVVMISVGCVLTSSAQTWWGWSSGTTTTTTPSKASGTLTACTYNVGGLPFVGSCNTSKAKIIGKELAKYDISNVQENFTYDRTIRNALKSSVKYSTNHLYTGFVGLDSFSKYTIKNTGYVKWKDSYGGISNDQGADAYAAKGIRYCTIVLTNGSEIDVYNYHTDAGGEDTATDKNLEARRSNLSQLAALVNERSVSKDRACIVMGDSNSRYTRTNDNLKALLTDECGLTDAWVELVRNGSYPAFGTSLTVEGTDATELSTENPNIEKVDKVMYRSSSTLILQATKYSDQKLTDSSGNNCSDHNPLVVTFSYTQE